MTWFRRKTIHSQLVYRMSETEIYRSPNLSESRIYIPNTKRSEVWNEHTICQSWSDTYSFDTTASFALWQMRHRNRKMTVKVIPC